MRSFVANCLGPVPWMLAWMAAAGAAWPQQPPALRIEGMAHSPLTFSLSDLAGMPRTKVQVRGHDNQDHTYEGVPLAELLQKAGLPSGEELRGGLLARFLLVTGHDGYRVVFSLPELDPAFTGSRALLADHMDGAALPAGQGPLRLVIPGEKRESRWVRMVERIELLSAPEPFAPQPVAPEPIAPQAVAPKPVAPKPVAPQPVALDSPREYQVFQRPSAAQGTVAVRGPAAEAGDAAEARLTGPGCPAAGRACACNPHACSLGRWRRREDSTVSRCA